MKGVLLLEKNSNSVVGVYDCEITIANIIITKSISRYFLFFKILLLILSNIEVFIDKFSDVTE